MRDIPTLADREEQETSSMDVRTPLQPAVVTQKQTPKLLQQHATLGTSQPFHATPL